MQSFGVESDSFDAAAAPKRQVSWRSAGRTSSAGEPSGVASSRGGNAFSFNNVMHGVHAAKTESFVIGSDETDGAPLVVTEAGGLTQYEATGTIVLMCFGVGLAVLPKAMSEAGYIITPLLMVVCAAVCSEQNIQVSHACAIAEELTAGCVTCYEDLANVCGGPCWVAVLRMSKAFGLLSAVSSFVEFAAANTFVLAQFTGFFGSGLSTEDRQWNVNVVRFFFIMPIMILLAMLKDLKHFARIMNVGVLAAMINGGAIALGGIIRWIGIPACQSEKDSRYDVGACILRTAWPPTDETSPIFLIGMAASVCLFGIMVAGSYPKTRHQMAEPERIEGVALTSFWLTLGIFGVVMVCGYIGTGQAVKDNAMDSFDKMPILHFTGLSAQVIDTLVASPIYILCVINAFESTGTDSLRTPLALQNVILRAATVVLVTTLSAVVPYPEIIMIEASFFGIFTHLVWPVFLTAMLKRKWIAAGRDPARVQVLGIRRGARIAIMLFGLVVCFFSIYGAARKLSVELSNA